MKKLLFALSLFSLSFRPSPSLSRASALPSPFVLLVFSNYEFGSLVVLVLHPFEKKNGGVLVMTQKRKQKKGRIKAEAAGS